MIQLKEVKCPNCNGPSYFPADKNAGYCINCGRIVNCNSDNSILIAPIQQQAPPKKEYKVSITYNRTSRDYDQSLRVELLGDANRLFYVSKDQTETLSLPEGRYQLAFFSHVSQGVHSTDVVNSVNFELNSNRSYRVTTKRNVFSFGLIIE